MWWQTEGKNKVDRNLMVCLDCLEWRDIKEMNDCTWQMSAWDTWNSKQMIMSCSERQVGAEKGGKLIYLCKFCGWDTHKKLTCPLSWIALFMAECWQQPVKGKNVERDIYQGLKDEELWQQSGHREIKTKVTTGLVEGELSPGSKEISLVIQQC